MGCWMFRRQQAMVRETTAVGTSRSVQESAASPRLRSEADAQLRHRYSYPLKLELIEIKRSGA